MDQRLLIKVDPSTVSPAHIELWHVGVLEAYDKLCDQLGLTHRDHLWGALKLEILKLVPNASVDDMAWTFDVVVNRRRPTLEEASRMYTRYAAGETPLINAMRNLAEALKLIDRH